MRSLLVFTLLALPAAPALADVTVTNDRGGSAVISRDCQRGEGQATCTVQKNFTGAEGQTASKTRVRIAERGYRATAITLTGPDGNSRTRERAWTRGD